MADDSKAWSAISTEQMRSYSDEARGLLVMLSKPANAVHPFALGLLGVSLILECCGRMNGDVGWWAALLTDPTKTLQQSIIPGALTIVKRGEG